MFRASATRVRSWWTAATADILGGDLAEADAQLEYFRTHPHRRALGAGRARRGGAAAPKPAHCVTPQRTERDGRARLSEDLSRSARS